MTNPTQNKEPKVHPNGVWTNDQKPSNEIDIAIQQAPNVMRRAKAASRDDGGSRSRNRSWYGATRLLIPRGLMI